VVAFSVAIPLLAALLVVNRPEVFGRRMSRAVLVETAQVIAQVSAFTGVAAGFWHISWIAGVAVLATGLLGVAVHSAATPASNRTSSRPRSPPRNRRRGVVGS
jgi:hypothetical protein